MKACVCVCMYVCMHACMYVCMYVCICTLCMYVGFGTLSSEAHPWFWPLYSSCRGERHALSCRAERHPAIAVCPALRANGRSPAPRKRVQAFSTARCCVSGAGCATLHRDQRLADRLRARGLVRAARCAALLITSCSAL